VKLLKPPDTLAYIEVALKKEIEGLKAAEKIRRRFFFRLKTL
jgi:hypothetical protein